MIIELPPITRMVGSRARPVSYPGRIMAASLFLGWAFDALFYGKDLGVSVLLFALGLLMTLFVLERPKGVNHAARNLWLIIPLFFFAGMVFVRANRFLTLLNVCAVLVLMGLVVYFYPAGRPLRLPLFGYGAALLLTGANTLVRAAPVVRAGVNVEIIRQVGARRLLPILRGLLLALPVLSLFTCLLASADLVFASYVFSIFQLDILRNLQDFVWRSTIALMASWLVAGALDYALSRALKPDGSEPWESAVGSMSRSVSLGFVEVTTLLVCVNLLFVSFGWVQFAYLFGGYANISLEGYTYADYARRGFFELVAVSVLTLGLILGLHSLAWRETGWQKHIFNGLSTLMVALVMVLLASAFWRMLLYEQAYGYTHLRLYVHFFEVWLAITFLWLLLTLWRPKVHFGIGGFAAALGFLVTLNIANPDALIAEQNLYRWEITRSIDVDYLTKLSEDAVPVLIPYLDRLDASDNHQFKAALGRQLREMEKQGRWKEWSAFNLSKWQAYNLLRNSIGQANLPLSPATVGHPGRSRTTIQP
jgi:hypothetical protein